MRAYKILKEIKNLPEGNFDEFPYDLNAEQDFNDDDFESLTEFFKSQGVEILPEEIKDIQESEEFENSEQIDQSVGQEDYNSPQEVEFWGEFKLNYLNYFMK